jgi:hypothetical protein
MRKVFLTPLVLSILLTSSTREVLSSTDRFDYESQVGVAERFEDNFCLTIRNGSLVEGSRVHIVIADKPQSLAEAAVLKKLPNSCSINPEADAKDSFYSLKIIRGKVESGAVALAVINHGEKFVSGGRIVSADLNRDGRREYFRTCTSNEGLHLTVWSGRPLAGKRRWHRYFYLSYDVVPSCKKRDYEGT